MNGCDDASAASMSTPVCVMSRVSPPPTSMSSKSSRSSNGLVIRDVHNTAWLSPPPLMDLAESVENDDICLSYEGFGDRGGAVAVLTADNAVEDTCMGLREVVVVVEP